MEFKFKPQYLGVLLGFMKNNSIGQLSCFYFI